MNLIILKLTKKIIEKALNKLSVNVVLDEIEATKEAKEVTKRLESAMIAQVERLIDKKFIEEMFLRTRKADVNYDIEQYIERNITPIEKEDDKLPELLFILLLLAANKSGQNAVDKISVNRQFNLKNFNFILNNINNLFSTLNNTTAKFISRKVEEAKTGFLTVEEAVDFVKQETIDNIKKRADLIVKNEIANTVGVVANEVYKKSGVTTLKWVTVQDERVCEICGPLDGKEIRMGGVFLGGNGVSGKYPPIHINCRCLLEPVEREGVAIWTGD